MPDKVMWQGDGTTFTVKSDNIDVLQTPLPTLGATPAILAGRDPVTGLLVYCPAPVPVPPAAPQQIQPQGSGTTPPTCDEMRYGVAASMANGLIDIYNNLVGQILNVVPVGFSFTGLLGKAAIAKILVGVMGDTILADSMVALTGPVGMVIAAALLLIAVVEFPQVGLTEQDQLTHYLYCQLACSGTDVPVTQGTIDAWSFNIGTFTPTWRPGMRVLMQLLTTITITTTLGPVTVGLISIDQWLKWAQLGQASAPLPPPTSWTCPIG